MSERTPFILIVGPDARLEHEVADALTGLADVRAVLHYVADFRMGVEITRSRRPDFVLVEMSRDLRALKTFAEEAGQNSPESHLAAVFTPDVFGQDVSESAVLIEAMRAGVQDFLRRPVSRIELTQLIQRQYRKSSAPAAPRSGRIISFISNKGGVGKSTLSTNAACGLAQRHPEQVLLIDTSLQMGVCSTLLDLKPATTLTDAVREQDRLDETLLRRLATPHPCGLHLLAAPANPLESVEIDDHVMARILTLARRAYDYVLVDSFPLLDRVMMAVVDLSDRSYVVLESVVPTVLGIARLLTLLEHLGVPNERLRLVLNRFTGSTDNLKPAEVEQRLGRPLAHVLPYHKNVTVASNIGRPYILGATRLWGLGRALSKLVDEVETTKQAVRSVPARRAAEPSANGVPSKETRDDER
jgi:pilus assembly protein CpaE